MTWSLSVSGHTEEPAEERKVAEANLLAAILDAIDKWTGSGNVVVSGFSFSGNEVSAVHTDQARELVTEIIGRA